ncbi:hypothetical protein PtrSN002B_007094 [Pyrenophora tritici-repentis]|uniref:Uncharacterized protein n=1 Tax=Pyrenophora tritici-repentis TaxID=45151 RepID=A0A2W1HKV7_9PLEO|nr:hypothetical protein PtrV1_04486 [Pyrenophora tritici-repentis]KAF7452175.1 hypothetical protein A1F99_039520 [Pyrenophora tritici-repentis]KAF7574708.1 hypothetical protein PtrM4_063320 [Pyrenophora tritici-repentis]KAG9386518.1 hypothetical protein A1F94_003268 [Pyrenophora tritici-repentis]KAI0589773.1 hypothetical protein Alg215_00235 [Pyrenophora tritici-repentis]
MAHPERNMYSNKESFKVNAGLYFDQNTSADPPSVFQIGAPVIDMDFSLLVPPVGTVEKPTSEELVHRLLSPPPHAFLHGLLSIQWVIGSVGAENFDFRDSDERYVLAQGSELRIHGKELGLPAAYLEWLCGGEEDMEVMSSDQGVCLTSQFFKGLRK